jgi:glycine dehydrogenase subunit 1
MEVDMGNYVPLTEKDISEMLEAIGVSSPDALFSDVPKKIKLKELNIPSGKSEQEVFEVMKSLASKNTVYDIILRGAGSYNHYIPALVKSITSRSEFVTAYTPYQAEISQGILQAIFEYQTMVCILTGMDVSNASVYNGASAAAEAVLMCRERDRNKAIILGMIRPDTLKTIRTYANAQGMEILEMEANDTFVDLEKLNELMGENTACVYIEQPGYYGEIYGVEKIAEKVHSNGAKFIVGCNPTSLALLKSPGECGADVAVGEGQPLGLPMAFGGPYLGFMSCTEKMMRKLPGRIVGETVDHDGRRAFVLTLQAREQHIRRERASSNICSNQALCALTATIYLTSLGKEGFREVAKACVSLSHYFASQLQKLEGVELQNKGEFFHEFVTIIPERSEEILRALAKNKILGGLKLDSDRILWCVTETATKESLDNVIDIVRGVLCY